MSGPIIKRFLISDPAKKTALPFVVYYLFVFEDRHFFVVVNFEIANID